MKDKIQKIREVIEKRYEYWREKELNSHSIESEIRMSECQHLLLILDSLQEEPVNEDLEDFALQYAGHHAPYDSCMQEVKDAVKAGANWQEAKDQSTIELAEEHAMLAGMEKMREEMMAKAVDGEVGYWNQRGLSVLMSLPSEFEENDKCKIILIKED